MSLRPYGPSVQTSPPSRKSGGGEARRRLLRYHIVELASSDDAERVLEELLATPGVETAYLEPEPLDDGQFHVDFNLAYNPYCAYGEPQSLYARSGRQPTLWSCPITPAENHLNVAIRAGERNPTGPWVENG